ncbi:MAG TPA: hypothetical protein VKF17_17290, partial [Isosphaeraceae bacterium]|nr:hypothetical protein [Isosphaeraceae bacterium]
CDPSVMPPGVISTLLARRLAIGPNHTYFHSSSTAIASWRGNQDMLKISSHFWSTKKKFSFI